jgi:acetyl esterase/lipase
MKTLLTLFVASFFVFTSHADEPIKLWPNGAPGEKGDIGPERDMTAPTDHNVAGKPVERLGNVSVPTITVYRPHKWKDTGTAVVVCPGGGYRILAIDLEGREICHWLNSIGVTGVLLKYRVPSQQGTDRSGAPLQDVQRAIGMVRSHAEDWHIAPNRIGVLGFSAGGHLSALVSTFYDKRAYPTVDSADEFSCRPDFTVLVYPAYLLDKHGGGLSPEFNVTSNTPPTFIVQAEDDHVPIEGDLYYYMALKKANVLAEMHLFPVGGHGYGLRPTDKAVTSWPKLAEDWMRHSGLLEKTK